MANPTCPSCQRLLQALSLVKSNAEATAELVPRLRAERADLERRLVLVASEAQSSGHPGAQNGSGLGGTGLGKLEEVLATLESQRRTCEELTLKTSVQKATLREDRTRLKEELRALLDGRGKLEEDRGRLCTERLRLESVFGLLAGSLSGMEVPLVRDRTGSWSPSQASADSEMDSKRLSLEEERLKAKQACENLRAQQSENERILDKISEERCKLEQLSKRSQSEGTLPPPPKPKSLSIDVNLMAKYNHGRKIHALDTKPLGSRGTSISSSCSPSPSNHENFVGERLCGSESTSLRKSAAALMARSRGELPVIGTATTEPDLPALREPKKEPFVRQETPAEHALPAHPVDKLKRSLVSRAAEEALRQKKRGVKSLPSPKTSVPAPVPEASPASPAGSSALRQNDQATAAATPGVSASASGSMAFAKETAAAISKTAFEAADVRMPSAAQVSAAQSAGPTATTASSSNSNNNHSFRQPVSQMAGGPGSFTSTEASGARHSDEDQRSRSIGAKPGFSNNMATFGAQVHNRPTGFAGGDYGVRSGQHAPQMHNRPLDFAGGDYLQHAPWMVGQWEWHAQRQRQQHEWQLQQDTHRQMQHLQGDGWSSNGQQSQVMQNLQNLQNMQKQQHLSAQSAQLQNQHANLQGAAGHRAQSVPGRATMASDLDGGFSFSARAPAASSMMFRALYM
ncbi:unnamed protein product [Polarella glacialis]|uniref:Uncharacterized protein n=1 Tax=Polarella glacialis TaxID=89957 RepID=A0A813DWS5_POLGL|nr:unnamed protein product [Polarella glacialis]